MDKLNFINDELERLREAGLLINIRTVEGPQGAWITVDGKRVLNLSSNNYLGLANDLQSKTASHNAIDTYGVGPAAVRTIAGTTALHKELEQKLAQFKEQRAPSHSNPDSAQTLPLFQQLSAKKTLYCQMSSITPALLMVAASQRPELYDIHTVIPKPFKLNSKSRKISNGSLLLLMVFSVWRGILRHYRK